MKIKDGVILNGLQLEMRPILKEADMIWKSLGQELVITCGLNGVHSAGSLHYYGYALDFRTKYFEDKGEAAFQALKDFKESGNNIFCSLSGCNIYYSDYDIIKHSTHIHVEYDPKEDDDDYYHVDSNELKGHIVEHVNNMKPSYAKPFQYA